MATASRCHCGNLHTRYTDRATLRCPHCDNACRVKDCARCRQYSTVHRLVDRRKHEGV